METNNNERTPEKDAFNESEPEDYVLNPTPYRRELGWYGEMIREQREREENER